MHNEGVFVFFSVVASLRAPFHTHPTPTINRSEFGIGFQASVDRTMLEKLNLWDTLGMQSCRLVGNHQKCKA